MIKKNSPIRSIIYTLVIIAVAMFVFALSEQNTRVEEVAISEIATLVSEEKVKKIEVDGSKLTLTDLEDNQIVAYKEAGVSLTDYGITPDKVEIIVKNPDAGAIWPALFSILPFIIIGVFIYLIMKQAQTGSMRAMNFGRSTAKLFTGRQKVSFNDVAGMEEVKAELMEVVDFLKFPKKYQAIGAEIPKGVLLIGPAGVGKTLLAKAVAGEAGVPFFSLSASEFVEMFVGVGASRVRDLFGRAKKNAPAVIFIDELDAIGRMRGAGLGGSHDEREQTLNQILVEMDGFETDTRVIVLAATNRPDVLDPALMRPGRFDRKVALELPDVRERESILKVHLKNKPLEKDLDVHKVAKATVGFSGADLKNVANEAAILTARTGEKKIKQTTFNEAIEKVLLGPERRSRLMNEQEKKITAYHEAGHAIVGRALAETNDVHKISIVSRGMALGYTWSLPQEDRKLVTREKFENELASLMAGRAAEELIFGEVTTGASNDLKKATKLARDMVKVYGMSEKLGPVAYGEREELVFLGKELGEHKNYSEESASIIDQEIVEIVSAGDAKAKKILKHKKPLLDKIAKQLLEKETIEGDDFDKLFLSA